MRLISPLEPLLPRGRAEHVLVIGSGPAAALLPPAADPGDENVDLVLLVPDRHDLGQRGWLQAAAIRAAEAIGDDGLVYALVPRRFRRLVSAELERTGLLVEPPFAHLPSAGAPRYLVQVERRVLRYAFERLISAHPRARPALRRLLKLPLAERVLSRSLPAVGLAARRPDGQPLAEWIYRIAGEPRQPGGAIVRASWRGQAGSVTVHSFAAGDPMPWGVAKLAPGEHDEGLTLERLRPTAEPAGARIPRLLGHTTLDGRSVVVQTDVSGIPAASLLAASPRKLGSLLESLTDWLARWGRATASQAAIGRALLEEYVLGPVGALEAVLPRGCGYQVWLQARCESLIGSQSPLAAAHNDLTMWNVVVDRGALGVLDWETAEEHSLPLVDFFYAVTDAVAASERYKSRLRALESCFVKGGSRARSIAALQAQVATAVGVEAPLAQVAFHACWLRHAANERAAGAGGTEFAEIAQWLAGHADEVLR